MNQRLRELRKTLHMTLTEFGARIGVKQNTVSQWENGQRGIPESAVLNICREFDVNENWFRNGCGQMFNPKPQEELALFCRAYHLNELERIFIENYVNLTDNERKSVFRFMTNVFTDMNETRIALEAPAQVQPVASAPDEAFLEADTEPEPLTDLSSLSNLSIDEKVALYRHELEREEKARARSEALLRNA